MLLNAKKKKEVPELSGICFKIVQENVGKETDEKMLLIIEVGGWVSWDALYYFHSYFDLYLGILC